MAASFVMTLHEPPSVCQPVRPASGLRSTHWPPVLPVMPCPKFWPFGLVVTDRFVGIGVNDAPPSVV